MPTKHKQSNNKPILFSKTEYFQFEKKKQVKQGVFATSRPKVPETQRKLNLVWTEPKFTIYKLD